MQTSVKIKLLSAQVAKDLLGNGIDVSYNCKDILFPHNNEELLILGPLNGDKLNKGQSKSTFDLCIYKVTSKRGQPLYIARS